MLKKFHDRLADYSEHKTLWLKIYTPIHFCLAALLLIILTVILGTDTVDLIKAGGLSDFPGRALLLILCMIGNLIVLLYLVFTCYTMLLLVSEAQALNRFYLWLLTAAAGINAAMLQDPQQNIIVILANALAVVLIFALLWTLPNLLYFKKRTGLFHFEAPKTEKPVLPESTPAAKAPEGTKKSIKSAIQHKPRPPLPESEQMNYKYAPNTVVGSLEMMKKLYEAGHITEEEYNAKKKEYEAQNKKK